MGRALSIFIILGLCLPAASLAGDLSTTKASKGELVLAKAGTISDFKYLVNHSQSVDRSISSQPKDFVLYISPKDHLRIKPYSKKGSTGVALQVRW